MARSRSLSDSDLEKIAGEEGIDSAYLFAIRDKEDSYDESISPAKARGRFQLLPATFNQKVPNGDINNPEDNARAAARYIKEAINKNGEDINAVAGYYFAGPNFKNKNPDEDHYGISIRQYQQRAAKNFERYKPMDTMAPENADITTGPVNSMDITGSADLGDGLSTTAGTQLGGFKKSPDKIKALSAQVDTQLGDAITASQAAYQGARKNIQVQTDSIRQEGELKANLELDKFAQASKQAGENAAELSRLGINLDDTDSVVAKVSTQRVDEFNQTQQMRDAIIAKQSVGLLDSPLEYIINQFTLPSDIKAHNAVIRKMNSEEDFIRGQSTIAKEAASANALKYTSMSLNGARAAADIQREIATQKIAEVDQKLLEHDYTYQARAIQLTQTRIGQLSLLEQREDQEGIRRSVQEEKDRKIELEKLDNDRVSIAAKVLGMDVPDRKTLAKSPKDIQAAVEYIMANGGGVGKDPMEAWQMLARGDVRNMSVQVAYMKNSLDYIKRQAEISMPEEMKKVASKKQMDEYVSQEMNKKWRELALNPNQSIKPTFNESVNNPYTRPSPEVMDKVPGVNKLPLSKIIADQKKVNPNVPLTDSMIVELAYANVGKYYKDPIEAARDVAAYYNKVAESNNDKIKFDYFGLAAQTDYRIKGLDLMQVSSIAKEFIKRQRTQILNDTVDNLIPGAAGIRKIEQNRWTPSYLKPDNGGV